MYQCQLLTAAGGERLVCQTVRATTEASGPGPPPALSRQTGNPSIIIKWAKITISPAAADRRSRQP